MSALLALIFVMMPINFFDGIAEDLSTFNIVVDCIFMVDCLKNFFTGYVDFETNTVVVDHRKIVKSYLSGWLYVHRRQEIE